MLPGFEPEQLLHEGISGSLRRNITAIQSSDVGSRDTTSNAGKSERTHGILGPMNRTK